MSTPITEEAIIVLIDSLKQGDTVPQSVFDYIKEHYTLEQDEYEPEILNVIDPDDEEYPEFMQLKKNNNGFGPFYVWYKE